MNWTVFLMSASMLLVFQPALMDILPTYILFSFQANDCMPEDAPTQAMKYRALLQNVKERIRAAPDKSCCSRQLRLVLLYWRIGADILSRQHQEVCG
jgi:hypothetical protein